MTDYDDEFDKDEPEKEEKDSSDSELGIDEVNDHLHEMTEERTNWLAQARASWTEIKKTKPNGSIWSVSPNSAKKRLRYPIWNNIYQIRKPLVLSRLAIPIGIDTWGSKDPFAKTACLIRERLAASMAKDFPMLDVHKSVRNEACLTNFGQNRLYYSLTEKMVPNKIRLAIVPPPPNPQTGQPDPNAQPMLVNPQTGEEVDPSADILQDDEGFFIDDGQVSVDKEKFYFKHLNYKNFYFDANANRWDDAEYMSFADDYSEEQFIAAYGKSALKKVGTQGYREVGKSKRKIYRVHEFWHLASKKVYCLTTDSADFLDIKEDPYGLDKFWPCPSPMIDNQPSDAFWPITEFYDLYDQFEEIHGIFSRMNTLLRAIRTRALFDANVPSLASLVNETSEADWIGVANLINILKDSQGAISNCVAFLPVQPMVDALSTLGEQLEDRIDKVMKRTGTSDLLQGETDSTERTYGEQQLKAKYAMNQIEPLQEDMQRFVADDYDLMTEAAIKIFNQETLDAHACPQSMEADDQQRYQAGLQMLKDDDKRRFRCGVKTDSTIALNEQYQLEQNTNFTNAAVQQITATAQAIQANVDLAIPLIHLTQNYIESYIPGQQFVDEIVTSLETVADKIKQQQSQPPPPPQPSPDVVAKIQGDKDLATLKAQQELQQTQVKNQFELQSQNSDNQLKQMQIMMDGKFKAMELQLDQAAQTQEAQESAAEIKKDLVEMQMNFKELQQDFALRKAELMSEIKKNNNDGKLEAVKTALDAHAKINDQKIEAFNAKLGAVQSHHEAMNKHIETIHANDENNRQNQQMIMAKQDQQHQHLMNIASTVQASNASKDKDEKDKEAKPKRKVYEVKRDKEGALAKIISTEEK